MSHYQHYLESEFVQWLMSLTHIGYDRELIIPVTLEDDVKNLYQKGLSVGGAMDELERIAREKNIPFLSPFVIE